MDAIKVTEKAREHLKPFASFQPISARKLDGYWLVKVDVGLLEVKVLELEIEDVNGEVIRAR